MLITSEKHLLGLQNDAEKNKVEIDNFEKGSKN
jgi:hypothetical protein